MRKLRATLSFGKELRKARLQKRMPLCVVVEELKELRVQCSIANLGKIETGEISCRADILGALCLIYEINPELILYQYKNTKVKNK